MKVERLFEGAFVIRPRMMLDNRGSFSNIWCRNELRELGLDLDQINMSKSLKAGTLRGLHYQVEPSSQTKAVICCSGAIYDVIVDMRVTSSTYLQWKNVYMEGHTPSLLIIPPMCAQGFLTLEDETSLLYLNKGFYDAQCERGIRFDDPKINIKWPDTVQSISDKDRAWAKIL